MAGGTQWLSQYDRTYAKCFPSPLRYGEPQSETASCSLRRPRRKIYPANAAGDGGWSISWRMTVMMFNWKSVLSHYIPHFLSPPPHFFSEIILKSFGCVSNELHIHE